MMPAYNKNAIVALTKKELQEVNGGVWPLDYLNFDLGLSDFVREGVKAFLAKELRAIRQGQIVAIAIGSALVVAVGTCLGILMADLARFLANKIIG